jgi:purine-binding chemotaxis protein CheW
MRELFLTSFSGIQYGIWKGEILSVRDLHALHRIPLSPARIAGILIDDGRTVTLADLPVCLGYESSAVIGQGSILLMAEGEKVRGFAFSGEIHTQSFPPELLFPLPVYLKTPVFDSCAIHDSIPIPIINIAELYSRVLKGDEEPSVGSLRISAAHQDISGMARIRFFAVGGEFYAVSAAGMDDKAVKPGPVTPLPDTPPYVKGVTLWNGRLLPVIDLSQRIKRQSGAPESLMLIAGIAGDAFGLLVDGDEGTLPADKVAIKSAPKIAQTSWLKQVVVRGGEIIPLVDLAMALSPDSGAGDEKPIWQRYTPGSGFPDLFFKHDVDVVEFSLLGERHALPKEEVEDVIPFKPSRELPDAPPIVIGVAEHQGKILPVVDLAMMFGRRSLTTPAWRMLLVNNGDFRALVITEAAFGERRLSLDIHRAVPIPLPHHLMYGCYPDAEAVRLILNVEAISVHFEKSLIKKFLPALSHEMRKLSTEIEQTPAVVTEPVQMDVDRAAAPSASTQESLSIPDEWSDDEAIEQKHVPHAEAVSEKTIEPEPLAMSGQSPGGEFIAAERNDSASVYSQAVPEFQQQAEQVDIEFIEVQEAATEAPSISPEPEQMDVVRAAVFSASTQESQSIADEMSAGETFEQEHVPSAEVVSEISIMPETITAAAEPPELTAPAHSVSAHEPSGEGNKAPEAVVMSEQSPGEVLIATAQKVPAQKNPATASSQAAPEQELVRARSEALLATKRKLSWPDVPLLQRLMIAGHRNQ